MRNKRLTRREFMTTATAGVAAASAVPRRTLAVSGNPNALALHGGTPVRSKPFPAWPQTSALDEEYILKALRNHRWCTFDGEFIPKFEKAWAEKLGAHACVMTPCGTHALHMAVELLDIGPGDEILVAPFTYIATIDAIMLSYALPVFVDTNLKTFQMDPADIEHRITEHTRAIMPVHILGGAANMDAILAIAERHNLPVIEDACQGQLAEWRGKKLGTLGKIGGFSFQESKVIPGGEAGALVSADQDLIDKAYCFRDFGRDQNGNKGYFMRGHKYRISDFAAAVLMAQLTRLDDVCATREKHAAYLRNELRNVPGLMPQEQYQPATRHNYYVFGMRYDAEQFHDMTRAKFIEAMHAEGIPMATIYPPLNKEPFIEASLSSRHFQALFSKERLDRYREQNHCPNNDKLCDTCLSLGHEVLIGTQRDVDDIMEASAKVQKYCTTA